MSLPYVEKQKNICLGVVAQDSDAIKWPLWIIKRKIKITKVRLGADTACAKADTNYNLFRLTDVTNDIASIANGPDSAVGQTFAAGELHDMTLVPAYAEPVAGTQLQFEVTKTGTGLALTRSYLEITYLEYDA